MFETLGRREVGEGGEDVELLDGWVSALEEGEGSKIPILLLHNNNM